MGNDKEIDEQLDAENVSDDSFYDDDDLLGDDLTGEEWDDFDEGFDDGFDQSPPKKDNTKFNRMVIAGAVIVGFIVMIMKVVGGGNTPQQAGQQVAFQQQAAQQSSQSDIIMGNQGQYAQQQQEVQKNDVQPDETGGFLNNPDALSQAVAESADATLYYDDMPPPRGPEEIQDSDAGQLPMPAPINTASVSSSGLDVLTPMPSASVSSDSMSPAPVSPDMTEDMMNDVTVHSATDVNMTQSVPTDLDEKLSRVLDRLDDIEKQMMALQSTMVHKDELVALQNDISETKKVATSKPKKSSAPKKATPSKPAPVRSSNPEKELSSWVLKSAQPGKALVARHGSHETFSLAVGDNLADLGRVTSIAPVNGLWVVQGTKGRISQ